MIRIPLNLLGFDDDDQNPYECIELKKALTNRLSVDNIFQTSISGFERLLSKGGSC